jgi:hypothetical protein
MNPTDGRALPYKSFLDLRQTERAIRLIKEFFQVNLGEVQCSVWPPEMREELKRRNVTLL